VTGDEWLRQKICEGALVSGKKVPEDFAVGWGTHPFMRGMKAHHWTANRESEAEDGTYGLTSACGLWTVATRHVPLCGPGNLPFCARCENKLMKAMPKGAT
jgi:hypothetical protein